MSTSNSAEKIVEETLAATRLPLTSAIGELTTLAVVVGSLEAGLTGTDLALHQSQKRAHEQATQLLTDYGHEADKPDSVHVTTPSYSQQGQTLFDGEVQTTKVGTQTLNYAHLLEVGVENQPGVPREALAIADMLYDGASRNGRTALDVIAANRWAVLLSEEQAQMANELAGAHAHITDNAMNAIDRAQTHIPERLAGAVKAAGAVERNIVGAIPGVGFAQDKLVGLAANLRETPQELKRYLADLSEGVITRTLGRRPIHTVDQAESLYLSTIYGYLAASGIALPSTLSYTQIATAIATRSIRRDPNQIFGPNATSDQQEIALRAGIAASLDRHQTGDSLLAKDDDPTRA